MLNPGQTIDRYTVDSVIGHGGTAVVYLVRHNQLNSQHALKVLSLTSGAIKERLLREGRVQAALQHTNIVSVTDVLDIAGSPGLLMEHIDGPTLDQAMKRYKITLNDALTLFRGIVAGVRAAHRAGLVHRDLKPANVLLFRSAEGFVPKVTDFGLAKVVVGNGSEPGQTRQGIAMGTPAYMAPEQIRDARAVDQRADLFSLGCILYELCTRQRAFPGDQALEIYNNIVSGTYTPPEELVPDLPDAIIQAIDGCLILDKERRIPDCDTLLKVLAGKRTWEIVDHPVPDDVQPTEEVRRDAPAMRVALGKLTPGTAAPRSTAPAAAADAPDLIDGTLGGDRSLVPDEAAAPRRTRSWIFVGGALALVLLVGLAGGGLALGWAITRPVQVAPTHDTTLSEVVSTQEPEPEPPAATQEPVVSPPPPAVVSTRPSVKAPVDDDPPQPTAVTPAPPQVKASAPVIRVAEVKVLSVPRTVGLAIDGVDLGRTPKKVTLPAGKHTVQVTSGDRTATFPIRVDEGAANVWCYTFEDGKALAGPCP